MNKYKLCLCDMDGTLLDSKGFISKDNEIALKKLQETGVEVVIASGRVDLMVKTFIKQLNLKGHIIACNGGLIKNITTGEILYSKVIDKVKVREIVNYCLENNVKFLLYTTDMVYSNKGNPLTERYENLNESVTEDLKVPITYINDILIKNIDNIDVLKILLVCSSHDYAKILEDYFSKLYELSIVSSARGLLDIMAPNISKGNALKILSEKLKIGLNEIIAFGDNYNDIDMLESAGLPIAMGNAVDEAKAIAKYITKSNDESGIAYAIENFILSENKF
ncbi:Cof-type HAD-IIB family hydrolase [Clostridium sp. DJ247]|uniref:Cof-type HAD-IIB family hydrolase n=1 Tax=Clostridium sp. DJ247 TaxID=2726188 RepID=UPI001623E836|nr:Cof-type HAD-IIB family hydrolase [Clostridium sp. DJ247]MBC2582788.1 HAD family phosphatase [Clostridium sp. DJ247]